MKKSGFIALGAMLVAGSALASNTGFKLNFPLAHAAGGSNQNWLSTPMYYFPNGNVSVTQQNALDMCQDLNDFQAGNPKVSQLVKWLTVSGAPQVQICGISKLAFNLTPGEAYAAVPPGPGIVVNVVGSMHDGFAPNKGGALRYPLQFAAGSSNQNWTSIPYHATADNALDMCNQWNAQASAGKIGQVVKWLVASAAPQVQICGISKLAFNVTPGEGYAVVPSVSGQAIGFDVY